MRLVTWNVGHRKRRKPLPPDLAKALASTRPDVLVLTDYVADASLKPFHNALARAGLAHHEITAPVAGQRQVLIAAREPLTPGDVACCDISTATRPNWLHVRTASGVNVVGFRVPMFTKPGGRQAYWQWLVDQALPRLVENPSVLLGDFNAAPQYRPLLHALSAGWHLATPPEGWSFKRAKGKAVAIDHGLISPHFRIRKAEYVEAMGKLALAGTATAYSDHAALVVDLEPRAAQ